MKLNPKCICDILSVFESTVNDAGTTYTYPSWADLQDEPLLQNYSEEEIACHCQQIYLSDYLYHGKLYPQGGISFIDIMPEAHSFLANMRIPAVFKALQKFISITGSASINQMATVASEVAISALPDLIGLAKDVLQKPQQ